MIEKLGPLPAADRTMWQYGKQIDHFTADQMREYAAQEVAKERERCASIVERINGWVGTREIATEIRGETNILSPNKDSVTTAPQ